MLFRQRFEQSNVPSLVERLNQFRVFLKNPIKWMKPIMQCSAGDYKAICREMQDQESCSRFAPRGPEMQHFRQSV